MYNLAGYRISLDNVEEVWSLANATLNRELLKLCIPLLSERFKGLCLPGEILMQTKVEQFEMLLEDTQLKGASEEVKFRAISK